MTTAERDKADYIKHHELHDRHAIPGCDKCVTDKPLQHAERTKMMRELGWWK